MDFSDLTITQAHQGLVKKEFSALELSQFFLERIQRLDGKIKAFLTLMPETALSQARNIDKKIKRGEKISLLEGVPLVVKDNILVKGTRCTAGSKILNNYIAPYDASVIKKLRKLGVVILGKTNLDEFAMGASTENSAFFPTHNPYDLTRVPGGSSGGSAAAVAAKMAVYALGSDTFGSIRQPASFCGVIGLKPTYGAVSRYGLIALASSLDQIGPITKTSEDAKIVFDAIKGKDTKDSTSVRIPSFDYNLDIKSLKIGLPKEYFVKGLDKGVGQVIEQAIKKFENAGAKIQEISLPHTEYAVPSYYITTPSEVSANLARYDGIKYGLSVTADKDKKGNSLLDVYLQTRGEGFGDEPRRRIMIGTFALSAGYYDAYYTKAQKARTLVKRDFEKAFQQVDIILTPTAPVTAFKIGEKVDDPVAMYLQDIFTGPPNLGGVCAISVPAGYSNELPVGLQIIGKPFREDMILAISKFFETL